MFIPIFFIKNLFSDKLAEKNGAIENERVQSALHWKIVEAAVHSELPPLNKGAIDKKSQ
jgi:hypothetical protein